MKKQSKKLSLNKKTISNLTAAEMSKMDGGSGYYCSYPVHTCICGGPTAKGNTCAGHKTCQYTCV